VHADDRQPAAAVALVPRAQVGQRAQAVDAGVGPEVDQHDPPTQPGEIETAPARGVEPPLRPDEVGRRPEHGEPRRRVSGALEARSPAELCEAPFDRTGSLERAGGVHQHRGGAPGERRLEAQVGIEPDGDGREHHHRAQRALESRAVHPAQHAPPAKTQSEQHHGGAERVGDRDRECRARGGPDRDHAREDRARARGVDEAERRADAETGREALAARARPPAGEARQRRLEPGGDPRRQQREAEAQEHEDRQRAQRAVAEAHAVDDAREARHGDRERGRESEHDAQRSPAAARRARGEQGREDGQHAGRERRAGAGQEREHQEQRHAADARPPALRSGEHTAGQIRRAP
jgi:hypothetical protein